MNDQLVPSGALSSKLARRRVDLSIKHPVDLPVPGYEEILVARYKALDYRTMREIGLRQEQNQDRADAEMKIAAETMVAACLELFERMPNQELRPTGFRWSTKTARELFEIGPDELPDGTTAAAALLKIVDPTDLMIHFGEYSEQVRRVRHDVAQELQGESEASLVVD